jgi:TPR repeat protein
MRLVPLSWLLVACAAGPAAPPTDPDAPPAAAHPAARIIQGAALVTVRAGKPWQDRCQRGDPEACLALLARLQRANTDAERASHVPALRAACAKKVISACAGIEQARLAGYGMKQDPDQGLRALDKLCIDTSNSFACSYAYERHARATKDPVELARLADPVARSCNHEPGPACLNVAQSKETAPAEAVRLAQRACDGGDAYACFNVGLVYEGENEQTPKDLERAGKAHRRGCDLLWPESCYNLARLARANGPANAEYDRLAELACTLGDSKACDDLAAEAEKAGDAAAQDRYCRRWGAQACLVAAGELVEQRGETAEDAEELLALGMVACRRDSQGACRVLNHLVKDSRRRCEQPDGDRHRDACAFSGLSRLYDTPPDRQKAIEELGRSCAAGAAPSCRKVEELRAERPE